MNSQSTPSSTPAPTEVPAKFGTWRTVVHNDPVNLMTYVEWVFESYFHISRRRARMLMLQVHNEGRAVVSRGAREQMEADAQAMQSYGLWATIEEAE